MRTGRVWYGLLLMATLGTGGPRAEERVTRGLVAMVNDAGQAYVGWRLLSADGS